MLVPFRVREPDEPGTRSIVPVRDLPRTVENGGKSITQHPPTLWTSVGMLGPSHQMQTYTRLVQSTIRNISLVYTPHCAVFTPLGGQMAVFFVAGVPREVQTSTTSLVAHVGTR